MREREEVAGAYERHVDLVYRVCYLFLKQKTDAEDAVQSVFLKYLQSPAEFRSREHEKAWLITTAKNTCRDVLRSWWKRKRVEMDHIPEPVSQEDARAGEVLEQLWALPEKYRIVLYLHCIEGYSAKETAELLGRSESTVRSQLLRGREKLKHELGGEGLERRGKDAVRGASQSQ